MTSTSTLGRPRFGGSSFALGATSLLIGLILSGSVGYLAATLRDEPFWRSMTVFTLCTLPVMTILAWTLLVDRSSLSGFLRTPEESVETHWYTSAATGAFHDILLTLGITVTVLSITGYEIDGALLGTGVLLLAMLDSLARYLLAQRRG